MDARLLEILCCPVSKTALIPLNQTQLGALNGAIASGGVLSVDGNLLRAPITAGLQTTDGKVLYRIDDGIPVLLPEEGIGTAQLSDWKRG